MPAAQLIGAALETLINKLLSLDPQSQDSLQKLSGKRLAVNVKELPWPMTFAFSKRIDLMLVAADDARDEADCYIELSLDTLQLLSDSSQLSQLIKQDRLLLEGDIQIAQDFSVLMKQLNIDWEEQLSRYTGDAVAHSLFYAANQMVAKVGKIAGQLQDTLSEGLVEEKKLAAHPIAVEDYCQQVNDIRSATERLEARLSRLEKT